MFLLSFSFYVVCVINNQYIEWKKKNKNCNEINVACKVYFSLVFLFFFFKYFHFFVYTSSLRRKKCAKNKCVFFSLSYEFLSGKIFLKKLTVVCCSIKKNMKYERKSETICNVRFAKHKTGMVWKRRVTSDYLLSWFKKKKKMSKANKVNRKKNIFAWQTISKTEKKNNRNDEVHVSL